MRKYIFIATLLVIVVSTYEVIPGIYLSQTTGTLAVKTSDPSAILTVSQVGHKSVNFGKGKAKIRLHPGTYQLFVSGDHKQKSKTITILKKQVDTEYIQLVTPEEQKQAQYATEANNLIKTLPYTGLTFTFRVSYVYQNINDTAKPIIVITAPTEQGHQGALNWIRSVNFDPTHLDIKYVSTPIN